MIAAAAGAGKLSINPRQHECYNAYKEWDRTIKKNEQTGGSTSSQKKTYYRHPDAPPPHPNRSMRRCLLLYDLAQKSAKKKMILRKRAEERVNEQIKSETQNWTTIIPHQPGKDAFNRTILDNDEQDVNNLINGGGSSSDHDQNNNRPRSRDNSTSNRTRGRSLMPAQNNHGTTSSRDYNAAPSGSASRYSSRDDHPAAAPPRGSSSVVTHIATVLPLHQQPNLHDLSVATTLEKEDLLNSYMSHNVSSSNMIVDQQIINPKFDNGTLNNSARSLPVNGSKKMILSPAQRHHQSEKNLRQVFLQKTPPKPRGYDQVVDRLRYWSLQRKQYQNPTPTIRRVPTGVQPFSFGDGVQKRPQKKLEFICEVMLPKAKRLATPYGGTNEPVKLHVREGEDLSEIAANLKKIYSLNPKQHKKLLQTLQTTRGQMTKTSLLRRSRSGVSTSLIQQENFSHGGRKSKSRTSSRLSQHNVINSHLRTSSAPNNINKDNENQINFPTRRSLTALDQNNSTTSINKLSETFRDVGVVVTSGEEDKSNRSNNIQMTTPVSSKNIVQHPPHDPGGSRPENNFVNNGVQTTSNDIMMADTMMNPTTTQMKLPDEDRRGAKNDPRRINEINVVVPAPNNNSLVDNHLQHPPYPPVAYPYSSDNNYVIDSRITAANINQPASSLLNPASSSLNPSTVTPAVEVVPPSSVLRSQPNSSVGNQTLASSTATLHVAPSPNLSPNLSPKANNIIEDVVDPPPRGLSRTTNISQMHISPVPKKISFDHNSNFPNFDPRTNNFDPRGNSNRDHDIPSPDSDMHSKSEIISRSIYPPHQHQLSVAVGNSSITKTVDEIWTNSITKTINEDHQTPPTKKKTRTLKIVAEGDPLRRIVYAKFLGLSGPEDGSQAPKHLEHLLKTRKVPTDEERDEILKQILTEKGLTWFCKAKFLPSDVIVHPGTINEQAVALNNGVFRNLIKTQKLADWLGKPKNNNLLKEYYQVWAAQWVSAYFSSKSFPVPPPELMAKQGGAFAKKQNTIFDRVKDAVSTDDNSSFQRQYARKVGKLMVDSMRAAFTQSLYLAHLEGGPVERILEAYCQAICGEKEFVSRFEPCITNANLGLSLSERMLLLVTMSMMLSVETYNPAVKKKIWTREKFSGVGEADCGLMLHLMKKIFDRIKEQPLNS